MTREVRIRLDATPGAARAAAEWARTVLTGYDPAGAHACELAVAEAVTDVVVHEEPGRVLALVIRVADGRFSAAVTRTGGGAGAAAHAMSVPAAGRGRRPAVVERCMRRVRRGSPGAETRLLISRRIAPSPARARRDERPPVTPPRR